MSYSERVRENIRDGLTDDEYRFACLYGILLFAKHFSRERISMKSESRLFRECFPAMLEKIFPGIVPMEIMEKPRRDGGILYRYTISDTAFIERLCRKFGISPENRSLDKDRFQDPIQLGAIVAGVFLGSGSINDPEKEYHMEFYVPTEQLFLDLTQLLTSIDIAWHVKERGSVSTVYIKESDSICDTLTFMGAQRSTLELIDIKIDKEVKNHINRVNNCDLANIDKTISAAEKQREDIYTIIRHNGMKKLTPELRELAELRLDNPHLSLHEISELLSRPIGRSGANHRFRKLAAIAAMYREEEKKRAE